MKNIIRSTIIGGSLAFAMLVHAGSAPKEKTALQLVKAGNEFINKASQDKVVEISSEKSIGGLEPQIWSVVYYDADTTFKAVKVKFGAGQKMTVTRPPRLIEYVTNDKRPLDSQKIKVDSDEAINTAKQEPLFAKLSLKATQLWLQKSDEGPVWKVRFWAQKLSRPDKMAEVGDVYVSSETGKVVRSDLHIGRVD